MKRAPFALLAIFGVSLLCPLSAGAHRLDEYLQATRLSVDRDRVRLEIDLTAGVDVASQIVASLDTDHDGRISTAEGNAYAQAFIHSLALSIDGRPLVVTLSEARFPEIQEMTEGVGTIRILASATFPAASRGRHRIYYRNAYQSQIGAYLVNVLVPSDKQIDIGTQERDYTQHEMTVEYRVIPDSWSALWLVVAGLAMAGGLLGTRVRSISSRRGIVKLNKLGISGPEIMKS